MRIITGIVLAAAAVIGLGLARAADWPQWGGPDHNRISKEKGLLKEWPKGGPKLAWTFANGGAGYSGPAVVGGKVYFMGARNKVEEVIALDNTGKELWKAPIGPVFDFKGNNHSLGPNATPTVSGGVIVALGSQGMLVCVERDTGKPLWNLDLPAKLQAQVNDVGGGFANFGWGFSWSPLIEGDKVIITPGGPQGLFAALDLKTGNVLWQSKAVKDQATYASPMPAEIGGVRQYIAMVQNGAVGVSAKDGDLLWEYRKANPYPDIVCPTPIVQGDLVYMPVGHGGSCDQIQVVTNAGKFMVKEIYSNKELCNRQGGVVLLDGNVYGATEARGWVCQDFKTGEGKWLSKRNAVGFGSLIAADGMLYLLSENLPGTVGLVQPNPDAYKEISRFVLPLQSALRKPNGRIWTPPVISDGKLYLRDQEYLFCYEVK